MSGAGLIVTRGALLTAALWERFRKWIRSGRPIAGPGIRIQETPDGTIVSAKRAAAAFGYPFRVALIAQSGAKIRPGTVNLIEPEIDGVPLSGDDSNPPPRLQWDTLKLADDGTGYIALEIRCNETWGIDKGAISVVQVAYFDSEDGEAPSAAAGGPTTIGGIPGLSGRRVRYPIARLARRADGRLVVFQIPRDNLVHRVTNKNAAASGARHFFWYGAT